MGSANFMGTGTWQTFNLNFTLSTVSTDLELRDLLAGDHTRMTLDQIRLTQTGQAKRLKAR